jgi:hypothetical protein
MNELLKSTICKQLKDLDKLVEKVRNTIIEPNDEET